MKKVLLLFGLAICLWSFSPEKEEHWVCAFHDEHNSSFENYSFPENEIRSYPQGYFRSPVQHTIKLSGTFGELRPNHFHSGIDIKSSNGGVGDALFAVADGYVARIKVQAGGFGKAIYIRHPNGYTSVFAHMNKFTPELEAYVKKNQYSRKSFSVDLYPEASEFRFKKGDRIGQMGNTGSSMGPHLHFEIRDSRTEKPVNPLLFGFSMADSQAPKMHQIKVYHLNDKKETIGSKVYNLTKTRGGYRISGDTLVIGAWRAGFGLKVYDHHDNVSNWNGIYSLEMLRNDSLVYDFDMETFAFSETRYINAHLDHKERVTNKAYFNRCFQLPGNRLSIYNKKVKDGVIPLHRHKPAKIKMVAKDANGNASTLEFWVRRGEVKPPSKKANFNYKLPYNQENTINLGDLSLRFPKGVLYENLYLKYTSEKSSKENIYANIHNIHNYKTPVHKYFDISIKPTKTIPSNLKNKSFIAHIDKNGNIINCGGTWKDGKLHTKVRSLGKYTIMSDNVSPKITPVAFSSNMKGYNKMVFKITDNYEVGGRAKGLSFRATVNDQWILLEHDAKTDRLIHRFDKRTQPGKNNLRLVVKDNRGNQKVYEREFLR